MKVAGSLSPTTPFHIARAYGFDGASPAQAGSTGAIGGKLAGEAGSRLAGLIGAVVPGGVDFSGDAPAPSGAALAMYRNPAEKNAAATAVLLGRRVDVSG